MTNKQIEAYISRKMKEVWATYDHMAKTHRKMITDVNAMGRKHQAEMKEFDRKHKAEMKESDRKHKAEMKESDRKHQAKMNEFDRKHQAEMEEFDRKHQAKMAKIDAEIAQIRSEREDNAKKADAEIAQIRSEREDDAKKAKAERDQIRREADQMRRDLKAEMKEDYRQSRKDRLAWEAACKKQIDAINASFGGYTQRGGRMLENRVLSSVKKAGRIGNIIFDEVLARVKGKNTREYDLVGINGRAVVVGEVKRYIAANQVEAFAHKVTNHFAKEFPQHARPEIYGMIAGEEIEDAAKKMARKYGLFIVEFENKNLVTSNVEHAKPLAQIHR